jgi:hypothetical protein
LNELRYALLGRGRWATVINGILETHGRRIVNLQNVRRQPSEPESEYQARVRRDLTSAGAQIAWLSVPPGPHVPVMIEAALCAGVHVIVEKPWLCSRSEAEHLSALAKQRRLQVGFDYEYCLMDEVERWRRELEGGVEMLFSGCFCLSRPNRLGISALENLGSHLAAIHAHAVPHAEISELRCEYDSQDRRSVCLEKHGRLISSIDIQRTIEPLIPRLIDRFESSLAAVNFPFDLTFAERVRQTINNHKLERA